MSGYSDLKRMGVVFRPIDAWPGEQTRSRRSAQFSASLGSTTELLARELAALNGRLVVLQVAMTEDDFRIDGIPYANAQASHPGVVIAFESKHGPLKFAVDTFSFWEDNLRAIALGMEALRKVDRYGVTKLGEQYTGWKALPAPRALRDASRPRRRRGRVPEGPACAGADRVSRCRSCRAEILWARTERGKKMPLDAQPVADATTETRGLFVLRELDHKDAPLALAAWGLEGTEPHYRSHFATCEFAAQHRRTA